MLHQAQDLAVLSAQDLAVLSAQDLAVLSAQDLAQGLTMVTSVSVSVSTYREKDRQKFLCGFLSIYKN